MKLLLPTLLKLRVTSSRILHARKKGFTLIELMVVVAIIAILSLVGLGIFNGVQGNARDARRIAEVNALAKNIESTRDPSSEKYTYGSTMFGRDYKTVLKDPDGVSTYCVYFSDAAITAPTSNPTGTSDFQCPAALQSTTRGGGASGTYAAVDSTLAAQGPNTYFSVCSVRSERGSKPICQGQFLK